MNVYWEKRPRSQRSTSLGVKKVEGVGRSEIRRYTVLGGLHAAFHCTTFVFWSPGTSSGFIMHKKKM